MTSKSFSVIKPKPRKTASTKTAAHMFHVPHGTIGVQVLFCTCEKQQCNRSTREPCSAHLLKSAPVNTNLFSAKSKISHKSILTSFNIRSSPNRCTAPMVAELTFKIALNCLNLWGTLQSNSQNSLSKQSNIPPENKLNSINQINTYFTGQQGVSLLAATCMETWWRL